VGSEWSDIQDRCVRGKLQPSVLFYERIVENVAPVEVLPVISNMVTNLSNIKISTVVPTILENEVETFPPPEFTLHGIQKSTVGSPKNNVWLRNPEESFIVIPKPSKTEVSGDVDFVVTRTNWLYRSMCRK
jgi:hypothetical protein